MIEISWPMGKRRRESEREMHEDSHIDACPFNYIAEHWNFHRKTEAWHYKMLGLSRLNISKGSFTRLPNTRLPNIALDYITFNQNRINLLSHSLVSFSIQSNRIERNEINSTKTKHLPFVDRNIYSVESFGWKMRKQWNISTVVSWHRAVPFNTFVQHCTAEATCGMAATYLHWRESR